jgi:hypothetical protein
VTAATPMVSVYDGQQTVGLLIRRGPVGVEAFTRDEVSLGLFRNDSEAANAVIDAANNGGGTGVTDEESR